MSEALGVEVTGPPQSLGAGKCAWSIPNATTGGSDYLTVGAEKYASGDLKTFIPKEAKRSAR